MIDLGGDVTGNGISKLVFTILSAKQRAKLSRFRGQTASNSFHPGLCDHPAVWPENLGCCSWI